MNRNGSEAGKRNPLAVLWGIVSWILVAAVVLLAVALVGVRIVGLQPFTVLSGSMEPTFHVGSLIYVKSVDHNQLQPGDPITYMMAQDVVVTHRIVEVVPDDSEPDTIWFITKGDANSDPDGAPVHYRNVIGKPVLSVPYLGYVSSYIQSPPGLYVVLGLCTVLLIAAFWPAPKGKNPEISG